MTTALLPLEGTEGLTAAKAGRYVATFDRSADAAAFYERLAADAHGFYVVHGTLRRNRANGRLVAWQADPSRIRGDEYGEPRWLTYWNGMAVTVGFYGSTFGEPPFGTGRRTAYLNGRAGPAVM